MKKRFFWFLLIPGYQRGTTKRYPAGIFWSSSQESLLPAHPNLHAMISGLFTRIPEESARVFFLQARHPGECE
jgi:hypothetical protein